MLFHCVYIPLLFIHSSVRELLRCFYLLDIVNNDAMNVKVLFLLSSFIEI